MKMWSRKVIPMDSPAQADSVGGAAPAFDRSHARGLVVRRKEKLVADPQCPRLDPAGEDAAFSIR